jgi:hypothetical protein
MKYLQKHRVKLIIADLEAGSSEPADFSDHITAKCFKHKIE